MYAPNDIAKVTRAGFDLTSIPAKTFQEMCAQYEISPYAEHTEDGFIFTGKDGFVVTGNNPITGQYISQNRKPEIGYASYIGIEGTEEFTRGVFDFINENCEYTKEAEFGTRGFI